MNVEIQDVTNVSVSVENRVACLTLRNPPVNALNAKTIQDISACLEFARRNDEVKAIVFTGSGKCFCAGADIQEFVDAIGDPAAGKALAIRAQEVLNRIELTRKPVIAAVNGACLGGGLELAMSCHIRIAAADAKLGQPESNLGLIPGFGGTRRLPRLVNKAKALELILTGLPVDGSEAERIGLVNKAVPLADLTDHVKQMAEWIALRRSKPATEAAIEAVTKGLEGTLREELDIEAGLWSALFATEDVKEGVAAFLEKRAPQFKDR